MNRIDAPPCATLPFDLGELEMHMISHLSGRVHWLRLLHRDGGIILRGVARTYHAKQVAQHIVMRIAGVPIVANEIEVA